MKAAEFSCPAVLAAYDWGGEVLDVSRYGEGHINETYRVVVLRPDGIEKAYILQKVNTGIFKDPDGLMDNIVRIRDLFQIAVMLIEHDMNLVMGICEGICVLNFGQVIAKGTPDEIKSNPVVIEAYLGKKDRKKKEA